ncbi:MAG: hypothetical protein Kow00129_10140 [Thermoleophilia bacterium]
MQAMATIEEKKRPLFMISIAAELADLHPQTLRMYERRGLVRPKRSSKKTRLYSLEDVERLRRIQELTTQYGLNLAGVELVLEMEAELAKMRDRMVELERRLQKALDDAAEQAELIHRSYRKELVPAPRREIVHIARRSRRR